MVRLHISGTIHKWHSVFTKSLYFALTFKSLYLKYNQTACNISGDESALEYQAISKKIIKTV